MRRRAVARRSGAACYATLWRAVREAPEYRVFLCTIKNVSTDLFRVLRMFCNPDGATATHSWVIVLHQGSGVCKASLRAVKPLWLRSPNRRGTR